MARRRRPSLLCRPRRTVRVVATALACTSACFGLSCLLLLSSTSPFSSSYFPPTSHYEYHFPRNLLPPLLNLSSFFEHAQLSGEREQLALQPPGAKLRNVPMTKRAAAAASQSLANRQSDSFISSSRSGHSTEFDVPVHVDPTRGAPNERKYSRAFSFFATPSIAASATTQARTLKRTISTRTAATTTKAVTTTVTTTTTANRSSSHHNSSKHALPAHTNRISQSQRALNALLEWLQWRIKYLLSQTSLLDTDPLNVRVCV